MSEKSILIIGAGIAGLSTGCYAQMNGYRTRILEQHSLPGGLCTAWRRKGYTFDGCIHDLAGCASGSALNRMWQELGALDGRSLHFHSEFTRILAPDGKTLIVSTDLDRLEQGMKELAPEDSALIEAYVGAALRFRGMDLFGLMADPSPAALLKALPYLPLIMRWSKLTLDDYAKRFRNPFLRRAFAMIQYDFPGVPCFLNQNFLAMLANHSLGWPTGGSLAFSQAIARRYQELGGVIQYNTRVERILVERPADGHTNGTGDRAVGVRLADGSEHRADVIVSAADGKTTICNMLDGRYSTPEIREYYTGPPDLQSMNLHVSLGVDHPFPPEVRAAVYLLEQPVTIAGETVDRLDAEIYAFDPSLAPPGKSAFKVLLASRYSHWKELSADRERYEAAKQQVAETVIASLDRLIPGFAARVEVVDVATPLTIERYTGNFHGLQAYASKDFLGTMLHGMSKTLPRLENFHMVGQWAGATIGVSTVAVMGRSLVRTLCKQDKKKFVTA
jgi:phytoene dehydrogenase-like protein